MIKYKLYNVFMCWPIYLALSRVNNYNPLSIQSINQMIAVLLVIRHWWIIVSSIIPLMPNNYQNYANVGCSIFYKCPSAK